MSLLFEPIEIGRLQLRNRVMRSATAERAADAVTGAPTERLASIYRDLAAGGVGLIVTGHACISMAGRAHPRMAAIDDDALIPAWREAIRPAQDAGARLMMQINYAGASAQADLHEEALLCPSGIPPGAATACRAMSGMEIAETASRFGEAARRAQAAGFDGVQIHGPTAIWCRNS
jgi:2,4-dienoyl-CoA reductase-like NADH-dependent reductase (Old Yellow Enzyme family)